MRITFSFQTMANSGVFSPSIRIVKSGKGDPGIWGEKKRTNKKQTHNQNQLTNLSDLWFTSLHRHSSKLFARQDWSLHFEEGETEALSCERAWTASSKQPVVRAGTAPSASTRSSLHCHSFWYQHSYLRVVPAFVSATFRLWLGLSNSYFQKATTLFRPNISMFYRVAGQCVNIWLSPFKKQLLNLSQNCLFAFSRT